MTEKTPGQIKAEAAEYIRENGSKEILPTAIRNRLNDICDSFVPREYGGAANLPVASSVDEIVGQLADGTTVRISDDDLATQMGQALQPLVDTAQAWAESPTEPGVAGTKSSKTWALEAADSAQLAARDLKAPVRVVTDGNVTLGGLQTTNGVALGGGDRVLAWQQDDQTENGIYIASSGNWVRSVDANTDVELVGAVVFATEGDTNKGVIFRCVSSSVFIGTSPIVFVEEGGSSVRMAKTRASHLATAYSADVQHVQVLNYTTYGSGVGGFTVRRVATEPSHPWKFRSRDRHLPNGSIDGTNGGWWEGYTESGHVYIEQFGGVGDGVTDDYPKIVDALAYITAKAQTVSIFNKDGYTLNFGLKMYYVSDTIQLKTVLTIQGLGGGMPANWVSSCLKFPANKTGIIVHRYNTIGTGVESPATTGADGTVIRGLTLTKDANDPSYVPFAPYDGIWLRARAKIEDVAVTYFERDGVHILATAGAGGENEGNANGWYINTLYTLSCCRHGLFVDGADANAGTSIGVNGTNGGGYTIYDSSFLGNTHIAPHSASQGMYASVYDTSGIVSEGGNRYYLIVGQEANGATSRPSTSPTVWEFLSTGGHHPQVPLWGVIKYDGVAYSINAGQEASALTDQPDISPVVWTSLGAPTPGYAYPTWVLNTSPYVVGGSYYSDNANASNIFIGAYAEGGQPLAHIASPALVLGGSLYTLTKGSTGGLLKAGQAIIGLNNSFKSVTSGVTTAVRTLTLTANTTASGWVPADTVTMPTGGGVVSAAVFNVVSTKVASATVAAGGSGGVDGTATVTGTTGTGTKFQANVTISGGAITAVNSITVAGVYTANPTDIANEPVTGASLSGAQLAVSMGVNALSVNSGGNYTYINNPVVPASTSGGGDFANLSITMNLTATFTATIGASSVGNSEFLSALSDTFTQPYRLRMPGKDLIWDYANSTIAYQINGPNTTVTFGRAAPVPHAFSCFNGIWLGSTTVARNLIFAASFPTTGESARGDIVFNNAPTAGRPILWQNMTGGTNPTGTSWLPLVIASTNDVQNTVATAPTANNLNLTAANISGAKRQIILNLTANLAAGATATLPTVAALLAALNDEYANQTFDLIVINSSAGAFDWTMTTNTGWTLSGTQTIAQNTWRKFIIKLTNITSGAEAATLTATPVTGPAA